MKIIYSITMIALIGFSYGASFGGIENTSDKKPEPPITPEKKADVTSIDAIQTQLKEIQISLQSIKSADHELKLKKIEAEISILKDQMSRMEQAITKLAATRVAASFTPAVAANGTIKIANTSGANTSVIINGKVYKAQANQTLSVPNQNAGDFTYEVLADGFGIIQKQTTRSLAANETFTINIYPR